MRRSILFLVILFVRVTAGADLSTYPTIKAAIPDSSVTVPKGNYTLDETLIVRYNLTFASGSTLTYTGTGEPFLLAAVGASVNGNGCTCEKCPTYFVEANAANCSASGFVLGMNSATPPGSIGGGACPTRGGLNFTVKNFTIGVVQDYGFFCQESGMNIVNCTCKGSLHQATIRGDNDGVTLSTNGTFVTPINVVVTGGEYWKVAENVQTVEARQVSITVTGGCVIHGDVITGQGVQRTTPPPTPAQAYAPGENGMVVFADVTLMDIPTGNAGVGVRFGSIFQYSKSQTVFKTTLPMPQVVVSGGGLIDVVK